MNIQKLVSQSVADSERKSWEPQTFVAYEVYRKITAAPTGHKWLSSTIREQCDEFPRGITWNGAKALAGTNGRVFRLTVKRERLQ